MGAKCNNCRHKNFCCYNFNSYSCPDYTPIYDNGFYGSDRKETKSGFERFYQYGYGDS